jgi:predicted ester cyclase
VRDDLDSVYRAYIDCLNAQDWSRLGDFVDESAVHNGRPFGLAGYRAMLEEDFAAIPDLRFNVEMVVLDPPRLASRLAFDCTPTGRLFGLPIDGRRVRFAEHAMYEFSGCRIARVWSVIDTSAIARQLGA